MSDQLRAVLSTAASLGALQSDAPIGCTSEHLLDFFTLEDLEAVLGLNTAGFTSHSSHMVQGLHLLLLCPLSCALQPEWQHNRSTVHPENLRNTINVYGVGDTKQKWVVG